MPEDKLRRYALDPGHRTGAHKARVFGSALGLSATDWRYLRAQILERVVDSPVTAIRPKPPYGVEYEVRVMIEGRNGENHPVITGWLVPEDGRPRSSRTYLISRRA